MKLKIIGCIFMLATYFSIFPALAATISGKVTDAENESSHCWRYNSAATASFEHRIRPARSLQLQITSFKWTLFG